MSVALAQDGAITLAGACASGEAETLLALLLAHPEAPLDWRRCEGAHAAIVQVLLAARRPARGPPAGPFLAKWVAPLFPQLIS
jgi:hypothetical protein